MAAAAVVLAAGAAALAYALSDASSATNAHVAGGAPTSAKAPPLTLNIQPVDGTVGLPLDGVVTVSAVHGRLNSVQVVPDGATPSSTTASSPWSLSGVLDPAGQNWQSTGPLAPQTHYAVMVNAVNNEGRAVNQVSHFETMAPRAVLRVTLNPGDNQTVGIGMPIELQFNHSVQNKDAILSRLQVTESMPVPGGWHWFSDRELHFRPEQYWPTGDQVTLIANLAGFDAGDGIWATQNHSVHFVVGPAHVSTADVSAHVLTVTSNGQVVGSYPLSAGRTNLPTMGGTHIAVYKSQVVRMISTTPGDSYDELVYWDVNITDGGEFVHAAPWSTGAQGRSNVSHGCINLSPANATAFYNFSQIGDIVNVVGSPRPPSTGDHGTMDWTTSWAQFVAAAAPAPLAPPAPAPPRGLA
jgi:lipoprotein-anchoring transpeptidase ErfK/SrfK